MDTLNYALCRDEEGEFVLSNINDNMVNLAYSHLESGYSILLQLQEIYTYHARVEEDDAGID